MNNMGKFFVLIFVGYIIKIFSQVIQVAIMRRWGHQDITAGDALLLSVIEYLTFITGFMFLYYYLYV